MISSALVIVFLILFALGAGYARIDPQSCRSMICGAVGIVAILVCMILPAKAQHTHEGAVGKFYQSWMMPDNRNVSCCHNQDCAPAASKFENGKWYAQRDERWLEVPASKIERERDAPDARSHLCARPSGMGSYSVFCFIAPAGI